MRRRVHVILFSTGVLMAVGFTIPVVPAQPPQATGRAPIWDGVFTAGQAARGRTQYQASCAECHGGNLTNGSAPALTGDRFMRTWGEYNLSGPFLFIRELMPRYDPNSLTDAAYLDILAYILLQNSYPAGENELTEDVLGGIRIVGEDGPLFLENNTLVAVVGCLAQGSDGVWNLTFASEPARASSGYELAPGELEVARETPLGTETFELQNFDFLFPPFVPEPHVGHKLQVKGALFRQERGNRIFAASVEPVAEECAA